MIDLDKAHILKFGSQITIASGGIMSVDKSSVAALEKWFPSIKIEGVSMIGWSVVMKYRPHNSDLDGNQSERTTVELEVTSIGQERYAKMVSKAVEPITVNPLSPNVKYAFAHIPLTTPLRLDVPFDQQRDVFREIVEHVRTLSNWYRTAILNVEL
jgi:hypothetical protein